jgi:hypothetical protein
MSLFTDASRVTAIGAKLPIPPQRCLSGAGKDARRLGGALTRFRGFKSTLGQLRNRWIDGRHSSPEMRGLRRAGCVLPQHTT